MKQLIQDYQSGRVRLEEVPVPAVRPGGILVATRASLVSAGTERQTLEFGRSNIIAKARSRPDLVQKVAAKARTDGILSAWHAAKARLEEWTPLGYSSAGVVVSVGPGVHGFAIGDRVACAGAGFANHAEFVWVPQNLAVKLPAEVAFRDGAFTTLGAIALHGVHRAQVTPGDRVAVIGLGLLGQLTVQILRAYGNPVFGIDVRDEAVALARKLGATDGLAGDPAATAARVHAFTEGIGVDAAIITAATPSSEPLALSARIARKRGRICVVGLVGMEVDRRVFYDKELNLVVAKSYGPGRGDPLYELGGNDYPVELSRWTIARNMAEFLRLMADGRIRADSLVAARVPLDGGVAAYERMLAGEMRGGTMLLDYRETALPPRSVVRRTVEARRPVEGAVGLAVIGSGAFVRGTLLPALDGAGPLDRRLLVAAGGTSSAFAAGKFDFTASAADYREALRDSDVRAVIIATRHDFHARLAKEALEAGKHVFVEKPLALDEASLAQVLDAAREGPLLQVGFNRRFAPLVAALVTHLRPRAGPLLMSYRVNAGSLPADHWTRQPDEGGGRILGEVCHFVDTLQHIAGAPPIRVHASGGAGGLDAQDHLATTLDFADGSRGVIFYGGQGPGSLPKERLEVFGGGRAGVLENFRRLELYNGGRRRLLRAWRQDKGHAAELQAFFAAVRSGGPAPVPIEEIAATSFATLAIPRALAEAAPQEVPVVRQARSGGSDA